MLHIYRLLAFSIGLPLCICLTITELKVENFLRKENFVESNNRDFLDIDVTSDVLSTVAEIKDVPSEKVGLNY